MTAALPHIGIRRIREDENERGHFLWAGPFGWHDCTRAEDAIIRKASKA